MSGYNLLNFKTRCPLCGNTTSAVAEFRFGLFEFRDYEIGDRLEWGTKGDRFPKSRPEHGNYVGEGYVECDCCHRDYWVSIVVRNDVLSSVSYDSSKQGYIQPG